MLSYLTTGSILFSLYTYFTGKKLKKAFETELFDIFTKNYAKTLEIETTRINDFAKFYVSNAGIIMGSSSPQYLKKCLSASANLSLAWLLPLLCGVLNYFFGDTSYKLYTSIIAVIVAFINYRSGLFSYFATQDNEQNYVRAIMNYRTQHPEDETVKMLTDSDPVTGKYQSDLAVRIMTRWLDRSIAVVQMEKMGL